MSVRQRKEILEKVKRDFIDYDLPKGTTIDTYMRTVKAPVLRRAIRKNFRNWPRLMKSLEIFEPEAFSKAVTSESTPKPEKDNALAALSSQKSTSETDEVNENE